MICSKFKRQLLDKLKDFKELRDTAVAGSQHKTTLTKIVEEMSRSIDHMEHYKDSDHYNGNDYTTAWWSRHRFYETREPALAAMSTYLGVLPERWLLPKGTTIASLNARLHAGEPWYLVVKGLKQLDHHTSNFLD